MKLRELIQYSKQLLKGKRARTAAVCLLPAASEVFFRFTEAAMYSLLLYFGELPPLSLFTGESPAQLSVALLSAVLRLAVGAPLIFAADFRLCEICREDNNSFTPISEILLNRQFFRKSLAAAVWTKSVGLIALIPPAFFGVTAYSLITGSHDAQNTFMAVHACIMTAVTLGMWLSLRLMLAALPFLMVHFPEKSVFRLVIYTLRFMSGRKRNLLRLIAVYTPAMLSIAAIPYVLPELMTAVSLSISIYVKEDEYSERNNNDGRIRKASHSTKLFTRKKRRFPSAADKAQTAGIGNNL